MVDVSCGQTTHKTVWLLYPREVACRLYEPVDTPDVKMEGRTYRPESWNIMCPHCGVLWAARQNHDLPNDHWQVKRWPCQACGTGSLWDGFNEPWNRSLPPELVLREMNLIFDWNKVGIRTYNQFWAYKHYRRKP